MAITRAQQFKQLVNPPMKGKKRPGYRGDDAYGGGSYAGGDRSNSPGDRGDGPATGAQFGSEKMALEKGPDVKQQPRGLGLGNFALSLLSGATKLPFSLINKMDLSGPTQFAGLKNDDRFGGRDEGINNMLYRQMMAQGPRNMDNVLEEDDEEEKEKLKDLRALAFKAEGGSMNDQIRQAYGLGSIVKKATSAVKKVAKSPIGKAALLYTATGGLGNLAQGQGFFTNFARPTSFLGGAGSIFSKQGLGNIASSFGLGSMISEKTAGDAVVRKFAPNLLGKVLTSPMGIITAASLLPLFGLGTGEESEKEAQEILKTQNIDIDAIREAYLGEDQYRALAFKAEGGRIGYANGTPSFEEYMRERKGIEQKMNLEKMYKEYLEDMRRKGVAEEKTMAAEGGFMKEPVAKKTMPLLDMGGQEMDLRAEGGFVPIGRMEKADDVPARLSKNEFVFTAEAVRNAGEGDVDKGAEVMYNMMKNLEAGGDVSKESQGLEGARRMFQTSQRLEEVL